MIYYGKKMMGVTKKFQKHQKQFWVGGGERGRGSGG